MLMSGHISHALNLIMAFSNSHALNLIMSFSNSHALNLIMSGSHHMLIFGSGHILLKGVTRVCVETSQLLRSKNSSTVLRISTILNKFNHSKKVQPF